jgi:hypothetical protein
MNKRESYRAKFTNIYGEEWHFEYSYSLNEGILRGSDVDWQPYRVVNGQAIGLILSTEELLWLRKVWADAASSRATYGAT